MIFGGTLLLNENKIGLYFIVPGGIIYAIQTFLTGLQIPKNEPVWELVYPELSIDKDEDLR